MECRRGLAMIILSLSVRLTRELTKRKKKSPDFYIIRNTVFVMNMLIKYADDTNLLVHSDCDIDLAEEFNHWAENRIVINIAICED